MSSLYKMRNRENIPPCYGIQIKKYHGLGIKHLWYNQQLKHLQNLIGETSNKTPTCMLLQDSAKLLCLEIGLPGNFQDVS